MTNTTEMLLEKEKDVYKTMINRIRTMTHKNTKSYCASKSNPPFFHPNSQPPTPTLIACVGCSSLRAACLHALDRGLQRPGRRARRHQVLLERGGLLRQTQAPLVELPASDSSRLESTRFESTQSTRESGDPAAPICGEAKGEPKNSRVLKKKEFGGVTVNGTN